MEDLKRTRIAPTPSGFLHIGNAYNFLLTEHLARETPASLRLRIDDLDALRVRDAYIADIFESLHWLGITPDEGPEDLAAQKSVFSQSRRLGRYNELLDKLVATGRVFACTCSRKDLAQHGADSQYGGACLHKGIPLHTPGVAWRIETPRDGATIHFHDRIMGDQMISLWETQRHFAIRRRDGLPAYHVASLCDDEDYGINLVVRGADLLPSTAAQHYLASLAGLSCFGRETRFFHHPLLQDKGGRKLSKSSGSTSLNALRQEGLSPDELRAAASDWWQGFL